MSLCTVTGNVTDLLGILRKRAPTFTSGSVKFRLIRQPRITKVPVIAGPRKIRAPLEYDFDINFDGSFTAKVQRNDEIIPEKTFYEVIFMIPNIQHKPRFYQIIGPQLNLNLAPHLQPVSADVWVD